MAIVRPIPEPRRRPRPARQDAPPPANRRPAPVRKSNLFEAVAAWTIRITGGRWGFLGALLIILAWAASGPFFGYSELWQLVINTGTTIVTFLMVFLIQNAQNRESKALHLKLDELIYAVKHANNALINVEELTEEELDKIAGRYRRLAGAYRRRVEEVVERKVEEKVDATVDRKVRERCGPEAGRPAGPG